jgi:opacity protein-like surface antigen
MNKHWLPLAAVLGLSVLLPYSADAATVRVTISTAKLRAEPWVGGAVVADLSENQLLDLLGSDGAWLRVKVPETGTTGYVQRRFVEQVRTAARAPLQRARAPRPVRRKAAPWDRRVTASLGAAFAPQKFTLSEAREYPDPLQTPPFEAISLKADYQFDTAVGIDLGIEARVYGPLGLALAYTSAERTGDVSYQGSLPHPLYLNRPRAVAGEDASYARKESAVHISLAAFPLRGRTTVALYAGLSLFTLETDLIQTLAYQQQYPYAASNVTLQPPNRQRLTDSPTGFHVGATLDYGLMKHVAVGAGLRYSQAKARLSTSSSDVLETDVGGLQIRGALRLSY